MWVTGLVLRDLDLYPNSCKEHLPQIDILVSHVFTFTSIWDIFEPRAWIKFISASFNLVAQCYEGNCAAKMIGIITISCRSHTSGIPGTFTRLSTPTGSALSLFLVDSLNLVRPV